ncbi:UDP-N-acetylmuramoyl-tripeptide--D-alanyl-D-alanine ligase [Selenihalanaerobacter shriftii]|uniref:UDP-N-acetylmuramoyl-tripeptide--D-alanyl-D-alanine ligase n=1 Tax=Selenihalanaerobacter shriftii TaxID=142842 RepID=A0A1T4JZ14_9FIRM|nr:UDP-N-acetylmuramoyl-tripeptide--D-alanyl-D-alanine ligase [Selenihalanaerobacter shriftii]SJZ35492.1 UDP-N-acetylmuramoyl-tripeptide--D-alanyl-D-alanine ligase [Selenihalanaerobacter shriftii]
MEPIKVKEFISEIDGELINGSLETKIDEVSIDSRTIDKGALFFAIKGERFDGHNFINDALAAGAIGVVIEINEISEYSIDSNILVIKVEDTSKALQDLAKYYRSLFDIPVIGVTGSTGKTTTKDLIASVLEVKFKTLKTEGNYNNEFGLPLTLFRLDSSYEVVVVELAMRGLGEIEYLCQIAQPEIGVITNVGVTHLETLGSQENIARAKSELVMSLPPEGKALLNGDDDYIRMMANKAEAEIVYYGCGNDNDLEAIKIENLGADGLSFIVNQQSRKFEVRLPLPGEYNVYNSLAAIGVGLELGLSIDELKSGLAQPNLTKMRGDITELDSGITIINDAYNANPTSMEAGLNLLVNIGNKKGRLIAVLGDMLELGSIAEIAHRRIAKIVVDNNIDYLLTVGELSALIGEEAKQLGLAEEYVFSYSTNQEIIDQLLQLVDTSDTILLKGSRGMKLEEIEEALLEG